MFSLKYRFSICHFLIVGYLSNSPMTSWRKMFGVSGVNSSFLSQISLKTEIQSFSRNSAWESSQNDWIPRIIFYTCLIYIFTVNFHGDYILVSFNWKKMCHIYKYMCICVSVHFNSYIELGGGVRWVRILVSHPNPLGNRWGPGGKDLAIRGNGLFSVYNFSI